MLRAGELFFRPQRVSVHDGAVLLADAEVIEAHEAGRGQSPLVAMLGEEPAAELDVLDDDNAWTYWSRSDAFTMALNLGANRAAAKDWPASIEVWVAHLLHLDAAVEPVARIEDRDWRWFVGLDAEATRIGNALWTGDAVDEDALAARAGAVPPRFRGPRAASSRAPPATRSTSCSP